MKRYQQQMILPEIGENGQLKLGVSSVLIVGAGGLGTVVATYLASMGVGKIGVIDFDVVDETNLHRQFLYNESEIGQNKATVLTNKLKTQNTQIKIYSLVERLTNENFTAVGSHYSIVCDCSDNLQTRVLLDKQCGLSKIPLVHGAVAKWEGYVTLFHHKNQFEYQHLFDVKTLLQAENCSVNGISSPICGIIGSAMANECLKIMLAITSNLDGGLFYADGLNNVFKVLKLKK